ncbi:MAG: DNA-directed RNA polymerase subunit alpha [Candidatus Electryoneaceae bacterium]|nr:DNA-directed RNA polymerase subunit alpha [Candidatus Electryoneaceae bacterium]
MNGMTFQMPESIDMDHSTYTLTYGKFIIQPLERGYGITLGNAIRRVLLSSLPGAAITGIRMDGVLHEFSVVPGVREDVTEIIMALKGVRFKLMSRYPDCVRLHLKGPMVLTAGDLQKGTTEFEVLNPDYVIAHLNEDAEFNCEITIKSGRGYVPSEENRDPDEPLGTIPVDAIYTPIEKVKYRVESTRIGQRIDYERLVVEIWTDGSITPDDALIYAGKLLRDHIHLFIHFDIRRAEEGEGETDEEVLRIRRLLRKPVDDLDVSVRAANCLKEAKIRTIADLVSKDETEMLSFKNFGRKSLDELNRILNEHGLHFAFDVERYLGPEALRRTPTKN